MIRQLLLERLERAATDLEIVQLPMVVVGGAAMALYVEGDGISQLRETRDVDVMVEAASIDEFAALETRLRAAGFTQRPAAKAPRCRWFKDDMQYDIVDVRMDHPDDVWARPTGDGIERRSLPSGRELPMLSPGRFLAAKTAALRDRGGSRWYESSDFEDIVLLLESHTDLPQWLAGTPIDAARAVSEWAADALRKPELREEIEATITRGPDLDERVDTVFDKLRWLAHDGWPSTA
jgi:hypothetical protein